MHERSRHLGVTGDVIIILGAPVDEQGGPSRTMKRRVLAGVELYRQGAATKIIVSGGPCQSSVVEAQVMSALALAAGLPREAVLVEGEALNTYENIAYSQGIMEERGLKQAIVVSDGWHLPRARFCGSRLGLSATYLAAEIPDLKQSLFNRCLCQLRELVAMVKYRLVY